MEKVLAKLREEHQFILQLLDEPQKTLELIRFIEEVHHPLEEQKLFPLIAQLPWLQQGGPRCSLYMGIRLEYDPLEKIRSHLKAFYLKSAWRPRDFHSPEWLTPQNPLSVPMEEHAISHELAESLTYLLSESRNKLHQDFFKVLYSDFCELLKMHIDKEDHCLFVMCEEQLKKTI
ncbi:MAG: hypothetical protein ACXVB1_12955 [Pseudobdellovibrionaceae bacterium]